VTTANTTGSGRTRLELCYTASIESSPNPPCVILALVT